MGTLLQILGAKRRDPRYPDHTPWDSFDERLRECVPSASFSWSRLDIALVERSGCMWLLMDGVRGVCRTFYPQRSADYLHAHGAFYNSRIGGRKR